MIRKIYFILLIFSTYGCYTSHLVYTPTPHNIPTFENKNETYISGQAFIKPLVPIFGLNGSLSHSITKNMGIISNATNLNYTYNYEGRSVEGVDKKGGKINHYEIALGYFTFKKNVYRFDSYAGFGYGMTNNRDILGNSFLKTYYTQPYVLISVGTNSIGVLPNVYLSTKLSHVKYHYLERFYTDVPTGNDNYYVLSKKNNFIFLELGLTLRVEMTDFAIFKLQGIVNKSFQGVKNLPEINSYFLLAGYEFLLPFGKKQGK